MKIKQLFRSVVTAFVITFADKAVFKENIDQNKLSVISPCNHNDTDKRVFTHVMVKTLMIETVDKNVVALAVPSFMQLK